ncbi:MAG TPA: hypothetical protein VKA55_02315 [Gammaproteobacteria bacterium]|nr:hypothetical protein [Gammaproteobacteria bacterium]
MSRPNPALTVAALALAVNGLAVSGLVLSGPAGAAARFAVTAPPLGAPGFGAGEVQYRIDLAYRSYHGDGTDLAGPSLAVQRRQALSDRFAWSVGGVADYRSGSAEVIGANDDVRLWQTTFHVIGEVQQRLAPNWRAILFAGPKLGVGGYTIEQQEPPAERRDADTQLSGYVLGAQAPFGLDTVRLTPFAAYEKLGARHRIDSSATGSYTANRTYEVVQYGAELGFPGTGLTLSAMVQRLTAGSVSERYVIYQAGYRF